MMVLGYIPSQYRRNQKTFFGIYIKVFLGRISGNGEERIVWGKI
jgi:hypothetical protein